MEIQKIYPVGFAANTYLLTADHKTAIAVDPAQPRIALLAKERGLEVKYVLLTHGHFDHIGGVGALYASGATVICHEREVPLVLGQDNLAAASGIEIAPFRIGRTVRDGDTLSLCGMEARVIATPGHTGGGCCYLFGSELFTGDTLFEKCFGRTDLPTGSAVELTASLKKLFQLPGEYNIHPGHGEDSTLADEVIHYHWL